MIKTAEELKKQVEEKVISFYPVHNCSMCGYRCGYIISNDFEQVDYDSGCGCTGSSNVQRSSWNDLTETYNRNQPENNPNIKEVFLDKLNETWKFENNHE